MLFWDQLLQVVEEGHVIPVVGPDLLTVRLDGRDLPLYSYLATRLQQFLGIAEPPTEDLDLNTVACRFLAKGNPVENLYPALKSVMPGVGEIPIPEPLLKLAAITPFQLFVTTTFDPFLERALNQVRFGGNKKTKVYAFDPTAGGDLPQNLDFADRPIIFHLFGRISALPLSFALTQEDTLEFFHSLQSETRRPNLLFDKLNKESLLIMGSSFGDWLALFFLRAAKRQRLLEVRGKSDYVAEFPAHRNQSLVLFLHHFSQSTKMFEGTPVEFVNELSDRWTKLHPSSDSASQNKPELTPSIAPGAVFLSYASEDRDVVRVIRDALEAAGIDVFFDKTDLEAGDQWEPKLKRYINRCSLFLPIISKHTLTPLRRFFRVEWDCGLQEAPAARPTSKFIVPVAIDDTKPDDDLLRSEFQEFQWQFLPDGKPTADFVNLIRQLFRDYQKAMGAA